MIVYEGDWLRFDLRCRSFSKIHRPKRRSAQKTEQASSAKTMNTNRPRVLSGSIVKYVGKKK